MDNLELGELIKSTRDITGLSQVELSKYTGLSQAYLSQIEHGKKSPTLATLNNIAKNLGKQLDINFITPE